MTNKHTPAPWTLRPNSWVMANGDIIATVSSAGNNTGLDYHASGETLANARLIAAAPDLLESLKALRLQLWEKEGCAGRKSDKESLAVIAQVDAAIAKAEGK